MLYFNRHTPLLVLLPLLSCSGSERAGRANRDRAAPVAVAPIQHGTIALQRAFSGSLEPTFDFTVAPKIAGRLAQITVELGAVIKRGQVVARLDEDVFRQAVDEAAADLAVAKASKAEAVSTYEAAQRELQRGKLLLEQKIISPSAFDTLQADHDAKRARIAVAEAQVERATATLQAARIRLSQTEIRAQWEGGSNQRVVAERYVDSGVVVSAGTPLLRVVELDPIVGVISVTEEDYGYLQVGQRVHITTAAHPGESFPGTIARIAPVFAPGSRQARVELTLPNADGRLKPGMFITANVTLRAVDDATIVPEAAVVTRSDQSGLFVVDDAQERVKWVTVELGIREGDRVQVTGQGLEGAVVTMGHQLIEDGSRITIPDKHLPSAAALEEASQ